MLIAQELMTVVGVFVGFVSLLIFLVMFFVFVRYFRLWIQAKMTRAGITIFDLLGMTFRKVNPTILTQCKIMAVQAGLDESTGITSMRPKSPATLES